MRKRLKKKLKVPLKEKHHKLPRSRGGTNNKENIKLASKRKHRAFHILFRCMTPHQIAQELSKWIDGRYEILVKYRDN